MRFISVSTVNRPNRICNRFYLCFQFMTCAVQTLDSPDENRTNDSSYAELKSKMQSYASSGNIRQAIESLNCMRSVQGKPTVYDYNALIYHYLKSKDVLYLNELASIYLEMKRFGPYPNASTFNTLFNGMFLLGKLKDALFILKEMLESGFKPSFTSISKLLKRSLKFSTSAEIHSVLELMLKLDYFPTRITVNLLIVNLSRAGMIAEAYNLFSVLLSRHEFQGAYNYNPILWALCKSNQSYTALSLFCFVRKKGLKLSVYSYTALIHGFSKEKLFHEAFHCLNQMKIEGCSPNAWTYTTIIKFLCDDGKIKEGLDLLGKMEKEGCKPNLVTYNIILHEHCNRNMVTEIDDLVRRFDQYGFSPDPYTDAALATGLLNRGKVGSAKEYLHSVISKKFVFDVVILNIYLNILCLENNISEASSLLKDMTSIGLSTTISYNTILKWVCENDSLDHALEFFDQVDRVNNWPDSVSCNTIFSAACKNRDSAMIRRILYRMEYEGVKINNKSTTCLIKYFCEVGKIQDCLKLLNYMMMNGISPNTINLNTLMSNLCKINFELAYQIFVCLKSRGVLPEITTYNILIRAALKNRDDILAGKLFREMRHMQRLKPDVYTYGLYICWLCREGEILTAIKVKDQMRENGINPNTDIYNSIMEAMFKRGKVKCICSLLLEMDEDGCEPNQVSFNIMNNVIKSGWMKGFPREAEFFKSVLAYRKRAKKR